MGSGFSRSPKLQGDKKTVKQRKEKPKYPLENMEELDEYHSSEKALSSSSWRKKGHDSRINSEHHDRQRPIHERPRKPPLPRISGEVFLSTEFGDQEANCCHRTYTWENEARYQDQLSPKSSQEIGLHCKDTVYGRSHGQGEHKERTHRPRTPPFSESEKQLQLHDTGNKGVSLEALVLYVYTNKCILNILSNPLFLMTLCSWL